MVFPSQINHHIDRGCPLFRMSLINGMEEQLHEVLLSSVARDRTNCHGEVEVMAQFVRRFMDHSYGKSVENMDEHGPFIYLSNIS